MGRWCNLLASVVCLKYFRQDGDAVVEGGDKVGRWCNLLASVVCRRFLRQDGDAVDGGGATRWGDDAIYWLLLFAAGSLDEMVMLWMGGGAHGEDDVIYWLLLFVAGSLDKTVKLWDVQSGEMIQSIDFPQAVCYVRFCHNDKRLIVSCTAKYFYVVDIDIEMGTIIHHMAGELTKDDALVSFIYNYTLHLLSILGIIFCI